MISLRIIALLSLVLLFMPTPAAEAGRWFVWNAGGVSTSYSNTGGSGNRIGTVTVTATNFTGFGTLNSTNFQRLINGNYSTQDGWFQLFSLDSTRYITFDFGSAKVVNELKYYQQNTTAQGTWKLQGSNDNSTYTDIGSSFALGGVATQTITAPSANTTAYRYIRLTGVSGSSATNPYVYQFDFKISS